MAAVSTISTMKVERPRARLSEAPTRLNKRSTIPTWARFAGTKAPAWASTAMSAVCLRNVDLPPMLGPVISHSRSSEPNERSLATKRSPLSLSAVSTTGWRPASISRHGSSVSCGAVQPPSAARWAWLAATSMRAMASAVAVICGAAATASAVSSSACAASAASACAPASTTRLASSCSSGELKRTTPASVWRWVKPLSGASSLSACLAETST